VAYAISDNPPMAKLSRLTMGRRATAWGTALTLMDLWRRIPPRHRRTLVMQARIHGQRLARQAMTARRRRRRIR
jgi:hypothetical protein